MNVYTRIKSYWLSFLFLGLALSPLISQISLNNDYIKLKKNSPLLVNPLSNDQSENGSLSIDRIALVNHGEATIESNGTTIRFLPERDYTGSAFIRYVACDTDGNCDASDIQIYIPDYSELISKDTNLLFSVNHQPVIFFLPLQYFQISSQPENGSADFVSQFAIKYTPQSGFVGFDTVKMIHPYTGMERVFVTRIFPDPVQNTIARNGVYHIIKNSGQQNGININILSQFYQGEENLEILNFFEGKTHVLGSSILVSYEPGESGLVTYYPPANFEGVQSFDYEICRNDTCEIATIFLQVSSFKPENEAAYIFTLAKNNRLVINYNIPVESSKFVFREVVQPDDGTIEIFDGYNEIPTLDCGNLVGSNLIIYEPKHNFLGSDQFTIDYCLDNNDCEAIQVKVNIIDVESPCDVAKNYVWPGDVDNNGKVDMSDVLRLGWLIGEKGSARENQSGDWINTSSSDWNLQFQGIDLKHADADGDGYITDQDLDAVDLHFGEAHSFIPEIQPIPKDIPVYIEPVQAVLDSGDMAIIHINLGVEDHPALDLHGFNFTFDYNSDLADDQSVFVDFEQDAWLTQNAPSIQLVKSKSAGSVTAAVSRANGRTLSGHGQVSKVGFVVTENLQGWRSEEILPIQIQIRDVRILDKNGIPYKLEDAYTTVFIRANPAKDRPLLNSDLITYPNPTRGLLNLRLNGYYNHLHSLDVFNLSGQQVLRKSGLHSKQELVDINHLDPGMYILKIKTTKGTINKKIEVVR